MGDRALYGLKQDNDDVIYIYLHWGGEGMMNALAHALKTAEPRWSDQSYANRIVMNYLTRGDTSETGYGIEANIVTQPEHSVPIVDWKSQTVSLYPQTYSHGEYDNPKFTMSISAFVDKFLK